MMVQEAVALTVTGPDGAEEPMAVALTVAGPDAVAEPIIVNDPEGVAVALTV
jgi:hypothetical protein